MTNTNGIEYRSDMSISRLTIRVEGRPPTVNGALKMHPQSRGKLRREWHRATAATLEFVTSHLPQYPQVLIQEWRDGNRAQREAMLDRGDFAERCMGEVHVEAMPVYPSGRSVPDPDGISIAVKWSLDEIANWGFLVSDTRHHLKRLVLERPMIDREAAGPYLMVYVYATQAS